MGFLSAYHQMMLYLTLFFVVVRIEMSGKGKKPKAGSKEQPAASKDDDRVAQLEAQLKEMQKQANETTAKLKESQSKLEKASKPTGNKKRKIEEEQKDFSEVICKAFKEKTFHTYKFLRDESHEQAFCLQVAKDLNKDEFTGESEEAATKRGEFAQQWCHYLCKEMNGHRNYIQGRVRNKFLDYLDKSGGVMPDYLKFLEILERKLDLNDLANMQLAVFYHDVLLPVVVGKNIFFGKRIRHFMTISEAKTNPDAEHYDITAETEALGVLMIENNLTKWPYLWKLYKNMGIVRGKQDLNVKKDAPEKKEDRAKDTVYESEHPPLRTKFTDQSAGQQRYGSWSLKSAKQYKKMVAKCKKARKSAEAKAWEEKVLAKVREINCIVGKTYEEDQLKKGKKVKKKAADDDESVQDVISISSAASDDSDLAVVEL